MKILFVGDIQVYHRENSYESGTSNLWVTLNLLDELFNAAKARGCEVIFHLGDLFEYSKPKEETRVFLTQRLKTLTEDYDIDFVTIIGNHDLHRKLRYKQKYPLTALDTMSASIERFSVVSFEHDGRTPEHGGYNFLNYDGTIIYPIPYMYLESDFIKAVEDVHTSMECFGIENAVLAIHQDVSEVVFKSSLSAFDDRFKPFNLVIGGHLHHRREFGNNFVLAGSPLQQKGGDMTDDPKGYYIYDTDTNTYDFHALKGDYPVFIKKPYGEDITEDEKGNYIMRYRVESDEEISETVIEQVEDRTSESRIQLAESFCGIKEMPKNVFNILKEDITKIPDFEITAKKDIEYIRLHLEGYRSYGEAQTLELAEYPLTMYSGGNGAGKSTPFRAMYWCEAGKSMYKGVTKDDIVTEKWMQHMCDNWRGTRVMLEMTIDGVPYTLARHVKFSGKTYGHVGGDRFMVFDKDNNLIDLNDLVAEEDKAHLVSKDNKMRDTKLWEIFKGIPHDLMLNSVLFDSNSIKAVLSSDADKASLLEPMLDVRWLSELKAYNKEQLDRIKPIYETTQTELEGTERNKELLENTLGNIESSIKSFYENKKQRLEQLNKDKKDKEAYIEHTKQTLDIVVSNIGILEKTKVKIPDETIYSKHAEAYNAYHSFERHITDIEHSINTTRNTVNREALDMKACREDIEELSEGLAKAEAHLKEFDNGTTKDNLCPYCKEALKAESREKVRSNIASNIEDYRGSIDSAESKVEAHQARKKVAEADLSSLELQLEKDTKKLDKLKKELEAVEKLKNEQDPIRLAYEKYLDDKAQLETGKQDWEREIKFANKSLEELKARIESEANTEPITTEVDDLKERIAKLESTRKEAVKLLSILLEELEARKIIQNKVFHVKGMKAHVIKQKLGVLTNYAAKYAKAANTHIKFYLDDKMRYRTELLIDGSMRLVHKLSDGQIALSNIIWVLSLNDLVQEKFSCNLLFMDEPYTNLDAQNSEAIGHIIRLKSEGVNTHLITHSTRIDVTDVHFIEITGGKTEPSQIISN